MITQIGRISLPWIRHPLNQLIFGLKVFSCLIEQIRTRRFRFRQTVEQIHSIGVESTGVVILSMAVVSLVLVLEFSFHMKLVLQQDSLVPAFSTVLLLRELGPIVTALLLVARVGAGVSAELATMRATEQLEALKLMGINPIDYLVLTRWVACLVSTVILTTLAVAIALVTAATLSAARMGYGVGEYYNSMFSFTHLSDVLYCFTKAAVFGTLIPWIACYHGIHASTNRSGAVGGVSQQVGRTATLAVVEGSIVVILADFIVTYILYAF